MVHAAIVELKSASMQSITICYKVCKWHKFRENMDSKCRVKYIAFDCTFSPHFSKLLLGTKLPILCFVYYWWTLFLQLHVCYCYESWPAKIILLSRIPFY